MSYILRYRLRAFLRSSMCATPIACSVAAILVAPLIRFIDERTQWTLLGFGPEGARAVVGTFAASLLTFIVFAFSIILLAVQIASGQLTPRIIARVLEGRLTKVTMGAILFSYAYTLAALGRIEDRVPQLPLMVAFLSSLVSVLLFLYLIQQTGSSLRAGVLLAGVDADTSAVIRSIYPESVPASQGRRLASGLSFRAGQTHDHTHRALGHPCRDRCGHTGDHCRTRGLHDRTCSPGWRFPRYRR